MPIFNLNKQAKHLRWLLKKSRADFAFDKTGVKNRLMAELQEEQLNSAMKRVRLTEKRSFIFEHKWSLALSVVLFFVAGSATAFVQADAANPGDSLYTLNRWRDAVMVRLPLPSEQKARIQADIVQERNEELDYLLNLPEESNPEIREIRVQAVDRSVENLDRAIERTQKAQNTFTTDGETEKAERMREALKELGELTDEQQKKIESLAEKDDDEDRRKHYETRLDEIKMFRGRMQR